MKKIVLLISVSLVSYTISAQNADIELGYVQTELEKNAVSFAVDYAEKLEPKLALFKANKFSLVSFSPELKVLLGSDDAFNGVTAKYIGNIMTFKKTEVSGVSVPDLSRNFNNFPVSLGFETNKDFTFINGIVEAGYVPWYKNNKNINKYLRQTKFGAFVQGGYKLALGDTVSISKGGAMDESKEDLDSEILRIKSVLGFSPTFYFDQNDNFGISLIGTGTLWYDLLNTEVYYNLSGKIRFILKKDYYFDLGYEKGSGAPNFNQGEQFTTNLGIRF